MGTRSASHRYNGAGCVEDELHKHLNTTASYITRQHGVEGNRPQLQFEAQDELAGPNTAEDCTVASLPGNQIEEEEKPEGPPAEGNDGLQTSSPERDGLGNIEPGLHIS